MSDEAVRASADDVVPAPVADVVPVRAERAVPGPEDDVRRGRLRADCARCAALCCVAPAFAASADFALTKPAGRPCPNLGGDFRCGIHADLRERGFPGCTAFDCQGAGQHVVQVTYGGASWRDADLDGGAERMFAVFEVVRRLHELLWYLADALSRPEARPYEAALRDAWEATDRATRLAPAAILAFDLTAHGRAVDAVLQDVGRAVREGARAAGGRAVRRVRTDRRGADLVGARLRGADLRGVDLRGALLLGADLRDADLRGADLVGADLRGADLRGADLGTALYVTATQLGAARGDERTRLPAALDRPSHWRPVHLGLPEVGAPPRRPSPRAGRRR